MFLNISNNSPIQSTATYWETLRYIVYTAVQRILWYWPHLVIVYTPAELETLHYSKFYAIIIMNSIKSDTIVEPHTVTPHRSECRLLHWADLYKAHINKTYLHVCVQQKCVCTYVCMCMMHVWVCMRVCIILLLCYIHTDLVV